MPDITAAGHVLPPGTSTPHRLPDGPTEVGVESVDPENGYDADGTPVPSDHQHARCVYPDGFVKDHQVADAADLLPKVINQLRGRYGAAAVTVTAAPKKLTAGATITLEVSNGPEV